MVKNSGCSCRRPVLFSHPHGSPQLSSANSRALDTFTQTYKTPMHRKKANKTKEMDGLPNLPGAGTKIWSWSLQLHSCREASKAVSADGRMDGRTGGLLER